MNLAWKRSTLSPMVDASRSLNVPVSGRYRLVIKSEGLFHLRVCGHEVLARETSNRDPRSEGDADVQAGPCPRLCLE